MDQEDPNIPSDSTGKIFEGIDQPPDVVTGSNDFISVDEYDAGIIEEIDIVPTAISREIEPVHKEAAKIGNAKTGQMDPLDEFLYWFSRRNEEDVEGSVGVTGSKSTGEPFLKKEPKLLHWFSPISVCVAIGHVLLSVGARIN